MLYINTLLFFIFFSQLKTSFICVSTGLPPSRLCLCLSLSVSVFLSLSVCPSFSVYLSICWICIVGGSQEQRGCLLLQLPGPYARSVCWGRRDGETNIPCHLEGYSSPERNPVRDQRCPAQCRSVLVSQALLFSPHCYPEYTGEVPSLCLHGFRAVFSLKWLADCQAAFKSQILEDRQSHDSSGCQI